MRLLNIHTLKFREFGDDDVPPYLVSSHRWSDDEASYKDVLKQRNTLSRGFKKIHQFCLFAGQQFKKNAFSPTIRESIWIDTCCINKNSSAEVSESINSMRTWYTRADHCIAYLKDVRPFSAGWDAVYYDFRRSEWFQRGWTLQELLAPTCVVFLTRDWEPIGRRSSRDHTCVVTQNILNRTIQEITHIPEHVLYDFGKCSTMSSESKMAWAADRRTTKSEDMAYCLLGILDVHMPLIYGEGARNAQRRLEEEIRKREVDLQAPQAPHMEVPSLQQDPAGTVSATGSLKAQAGVINEALVHAQEAQRTILYEQNLIDTHREETIDETDLCPVCQRLLYSPVMTACNHTICNSCMEKHADVSLEDPNMTIVSLDEKAQDLDTVLDV